MCFNLRYMKYEKISRQMQIRDNSLMLITRNIKSLDFVLHIACLYRIVSVINGCLTSHFPEWFVEELFLYEPRSVYAWWEIPSSSNCWTVIIQLMPLYFIWKLHVKLSSKTIHSELVVKFEHSQQGYPQTLCHNPRTVIPMLIC